jgi:hypothetical protein
MSCRFSRPLSSSTRRAKTSLSVVSATARRVVVPGAMARSTPRSDSDFQLSRSRPAFAPRTSDRPRGAALRSAGSLLARNSSIVASPRTASAGPAARASQRTLPLKLVWAFCTSRLKTWSR